MNFTNYEMKEYANDRLPFWCGVSNGFPHWHWHKAPELLFGLEGQSLVYCNDRYLRYRVSCYTHCFVMECLWASCNSFANPDWRTRCRNYYVWTDDFIT